MLVSTDTLVRILGPRRGSFDPVAVSLVIVLLLAAVTLAACQGGMGAPTTPPPIVVSPTTGSPIATTATPSADVEIDRLFIDAMVPHHEGRSELASIALTRVEHPELRPLLSDLDRMQSAETNQMRRWRQEWCGSAVTPPIDRVPNVVATPGAGSAPSINLAAEVVRLRSAPAPIDRLFIDAMIPHHANGIAIARLAQQESTRLELKELGRTMIERLQRESEQVSRWRRDRYGSSDQNASTPGSGGAPGVQPSLPTRGSDDPHAGH